MAWTGFGGGKGSINSGNQNMASGNPSAANYGGGDRGGNTGGNGNSGGNSQGGIGRSTSAATSAAAASAAAPSTGIGDTNKQGGVMGGLMGAVQSARDSRTSSPSTTQSAVNGAFASSESAAPEAATAGKRMSEAAAKGFDAQSNAGMTESAFGVGGSVGSLAGKAIGATMTGDPYAKGSPESTAFGMGRQEAKDAGLGSTTKGLASLAAGVLGGPIGSALASMALGGVSYAMQQEAREKGFPGVAKAAPNAGNPTTNGSVGDNASQLGSGGGRGMAGSMAEAAGAANAADVPTPFEFASDYSKERDPTKLNLGSII